MIFSLISMAGWVDSLHTHEICGLQVLNSPAFGFLRTFTQSLNEGSSGRKLNSELSAGVSAREGCG